MGKNTKKATAFIESIPNAKLTGLPTGGGTIFKDTDFRLDMQGLTSGTPQNHNLQVQINKETTISSLKKSAPKTISTLLVSKDDPPSAETIKKDLIENLTI